MLGCAAGAPTVESREYADRQPLNPRSTDGRAIHVGYGHHPECFVFTGGDAEPDRSAEPIECPAKALRVLSACRAALLYEASSGGCVCVPAGGDAPTRVDCP
jgi:hypothetical protein